jgi:tripartite-type tricarboxylate transporter receptor subunit TctC
MRAKKKIILGIICLISVIIFNQPLVAISADLKYPTKPIKLIVPFAAGGPTDVVCRKLADGAGKDLGQEVIVENKTGGGGAVGSRFVAFSKPDGYTIGSLGSASVVIQPNIEGKMDFNPTVDFTPIVQYATADHPLAVPVDSPFKTFKDFMEEGRKREVSYAGMGTTAADIAMARLAIVAKIKLKQVPFAGGSQVVAAALGGHTDAVVSSGMYEYVRAGKLRLLAQTTSERNKEFPDVPTLKELAYNIETRVFYGLVAPKGLPEQIREKLEKAFTKAIEDPSFAQIVHNASFNLVYKDGRDFGNYIKQVYEVSAKEFKELGIGKYSKEKK